MGKNIFKLLADKSISSISVYADKTIFLNRW